MKRRLIDRIHDRLWSVVTESLEKNQPLPSGASQENGGASVSGAMDWPMACAALNAGHWSTKDFRKSKAVRQVVETLGPVDGRYFAKLIRKWEPALLRDPKVREIDGWGDPIRWPAILLGTPQSFSPTTLRYLAQALWIKRQGYLPRHAEIVEIGVGYGGLAAMNARVSGAKTTFVDLPNVESTALRMLDDIGLGNCARLSDEKDTPPATFVISNYAFTELNGDLQEDYFHRYLKPSKHGMIISNASIFARSIEGRTNDELVAWFRAEGIPAEFEKSNEVLAPTDEMCGNAIIHW
jgi:hypothetical protein